MSGQTAQILAIRKLRRDILLSRIERTRNRVADTTAALEIADAEKLGILQFRQQRARDLRKSAHIELQALNKRKQEEAELLLLNLHRERISLAQEQVALRRTEAKLDALQNYVDELIASTDDADDD